MLRFDKKIEYKQAKPNNCKIHFQTHQVQTKPNSQDEVQANIERQHAVRLEKVSFA